MTNDIKEILDNLIRFRNEDNNFQPEDILAIEDVWLLLDYITNLQEENKEWSMIFDTFSKRPYAHKYLEEKKKELGNKKIIGLDSEMIYKDYFDYKSRNKKAIEYIQNDMPYLEEPDDDYENTHKIKEYDKSVLLNILQGSDKDE